MIYDGLHFNPAAGLSYKVRPPQTKPDGTLRERDMGTPHGGVASPLRTNLFLHYVFDTWMGRIYPDMPFERLK